MRWLAGNFAIIRALPPGNLERWGQQQGFFYVKTLNGIHLCIMCALALVGKWRSKKICSGMHRGRVNSNVASISLVSKYVLSLSCFSCFSLWDSSCGALPLPWIRWCFRLNGKSEVCRARPAILLNRSPVSPVFNLWAVTQPNLAWTWRDAVAFEVASGAHVGCFHRAVTFHSCRIVGCSRRTLMPACTANIRGPDFEVSHTLVFAYCILRRRLMLPRCWRDIVCSSSVSTLLSSSIVCFSRVFRGVYSSCAILACVIQLASA
jgi:hypothetical protein